MNEEECNKYKGYCRYDTVAQKCFLGAALMPRRSNSVSDVVPRADIDGHRMLKEQRERKKVQRN